MKIKETDLARHLVEALRIDHDVYQEVTVNSDIVDVVAVAGSVMWGIEVKTTLNLQVLGQALYDRMWFHYVSVAVPKAKRSRGKSGMAAREFCRQNGIGLIYISPRGKIEEDVKARFNRRALTNRVHLYEEQKTYAEAGNAEGKRWTPFRATREKLFEYVSRYPGCTIKDAIENISHHYASPSSARTSLSRLIIDGVIDELVMEDGKLHIAADEMAG